MVDINEAKERFAQLLDCLLYTSFLFCARFLSMALFLPFYHRITVFAPAPFFIRGLTAGRRTV